MLKAIKPQTRKGQTRQTTLEQRFWLKVVVAGDDDCWIWIGCVCGRISKSKLVHKYGNIRSGKKMRRATQVSWEIAHGKKFPKGKKCCHTCDNTLCVNPKHLFAGTNKDNWDDMVQKGRGPTKEQLSNKGEAGGMAKLTTAEVIQIRELYVTGKFRHVDLAKKFNIGKSTVGQIISGVRWPHIKKGLA